MTRSLMAALALASCLAPSLACAQTIVIVDPPPPVIVVVEPPPPIIMVVEPPPALVVVEAPPPPPPPAASASAPLHLRGLLDLGADFIVLDGAAMGASIRGGVMFDDGFTLELALAYRGGLDSGGEANLGIELQRDFSPQRAAGFLLLGRLGTAFLLDARDDSFDAGIRLDGQVGIGGRFDISDDVAIVTDLRAVVRFRPDDPRGAASRDIDAGVLYTVGVRIRL